MLKRPRVVDVCITVITLAVTVDVGVRLFDRYPSGSSAPTAPPTRGVDIGIQEGDVLPAVNTLDLAKGKDTLLMFVSSTCGFCTASMDFYGQLADRVSSLPPNSFRLVAVSSETEEEIKNYLGSHKVAVTESVSLGDGALAAFRVSGTPTLLLVNASGTVKKVWVGRLSPSREKEVMAQIGLP